MAQLIQLKMLEMLNSPAPFTHTGGHVVNGAAAAASPATPSPRITFAVLTARCEYVYMFSSRDVVELVDANRNGLCRLQEISQALSSGLINEAQAARAKEMETAAYFGDNGPV